MFEWVATCKGSVSAEHGLGFMKPHALHYSKSLEAVSHFSILKIGVYLLKYGLITLLAFSLFKEV